MNGKVLFYLHSIIQINLSYADYGSQGKNCVFFQVLQEKTRKVGIYMQLRNKSKTMTKKESCLSQAKHVYICRVMMQKWPTTVMLDIVEICITQLKWTKAILCADFE